MSKTDDILEKIKNSPEQWYDVADVSIIAEISPKSVRDRRDVERTIDPNDGFVYIHKRSVIEIIERNRCAIDGWDLSEEIAKEYGEGYRLMKYYIPKYNIRNSLDYCRKKRIHPDDVPKLRSLLSNRKIKDPMMIKGVRHHLLSRVAVDILKYQGEDVKLKHKKYKVIHQWVLDKSSCFSCEHIGNSHRVFIPDGDYQILINGTTMLEAAKRTGISYDTIRRYAKSGCLPRYEIGKGNSIVRVDEVEMARRIYHLVSHLKSKNIKFSWKEDAECRMNDKIHYIAEEEAIRIFYNDTPIILVMFFSNFFSMFGKLITDYTVKGFDTKYHGEVCVDPKVFFEIIAKKNKTFRLV